MLLGAKALNVLYVAVYKVSFVPVLNYKEHLQDVWGSRSAALGKQPLLLNGQKTGGDVQKDGTLRRKEKYFLFFLSGIGKWFSAFQSVAYSLL